MGHWPGDIPVSVRQTANIKTGDVANVRVLSLSAHTGTHMDAPLHFVDDGESIDGRRGERVREPALEEDDLIVEQAVDAEVLLDLCSGDRQEALLEVLVAAVRRVLGGVGRRQALERVGDEDAPVRDAVGGVL